MIKIEELVERSKKNDKEAYVQLIEYLQKDLFKIAIAKLKNEDDAQDAVQATVVNAYMNIEKLENNRYFKTWIIKILLNECNRYYRRAKKDNELLEKYSNLNNLSSVQQVDNTIDFEKLIDTLNEHEKTIFKLFYQKGFTTREIAKMLNLKQTTVKATLCRGRKKIKKKLNPTVFIIFIFCLFFTSSIIATTCIQYLKDLFDTSSVGVNNDGILSAIEDENWYQSVNMNYIDLGNGYKIKVEYLLLDNMNLYLMFDFNSENDIKNFDNMSLLDLKITNEKNELILDHRYALSNQYAKTYGDKLISHSPHNMKYLVYMHTIDFPVSNKLKISFSDITLYKKTFFSMVEKKIKKNVNFNIVLDDKFLNMEYTPYFCNNKNIEKAIITETGFYAIVNKNKNYIHKVALSDDLGNYYDCYFTTLTGTNYKYIIKSNFKDISTNNLTLTIDEQQYLLKK